ncbi:MAG: molybdenum cofactor biosynthesis protein MoaB [Methanosarcinales archaeon]|nr:molybdenum cofactor biosynthesis protein MoaB [Methanosarcinales archaeon]
MKIDVITVSTSRFRQHGSVAGPEEAKDLSGQEILTRVRSAGHLASYSLLPDGIQPLRGRVQELAAGQSDALVICGGTGLAPLDLSIEAVEPLYQKSIPGFGEIFRLRSLEEIGTRAMLTRASAGVVQGVPVFCLPGSPGAARLGTDLILLELEHILHHVRNG